MNYTDCPSSSTSAGIGDLQNKTWAGEAGSRYNRAKSGGRFKEKKELRK